MDTDDLIRLALLERLPPVGDAEEDEAWTSIQERAHHEQHRRHLPLVAAITAVVLVLVGAVALLRSGDGTRDGSDVATRRDASAPAPAAPGAWRTLASSPLPARQSASLAWTGDEVLVMGGTDQVCPSDTRCVAPPGGRADGAAYDPATDTWRSIADAPVAFSGAPAVWTGDVALVFVGAGPQGNATLLAYEPGADRWSTRAAPAVGQPVPVWTGEVAVVVAPWTADGQVDWAYDPAEDTWSELPADPAGCGEGREGVWGSDRLVVFARPCLDPQGGGLEPSSYYRVATLDLKAGTWRSLPDSGVAGWGSWSVHGDKLVSLAVGAYDRVDNGLARPHELGGVLDLAAGTWEPISRPGPEVIAAPSHGFHGTAGNWVVTGRRMYEPDTGRWQVIPPPPAGTGDNPAAVWTGTEILVWGGVGGDGGLVGTGAAFSPPEL